MSKASFLIEIEMPAEARWLKPQDQVAYTAQNLMKDFFERFIACDIGGVEVTVRPFDWRVPTPGSPG